MARKRKRKSSRPALGSQGEQALQRTSVLPRRKRAERDTVLPSPRVRRTKESEHHVSLAPVKREQRQLFGHSPTAAATRADAVMRRTRSVKKRLVEHRENLPEALREAICADYRKDQARRRRSLFGTGRSGANPGPRKRDWRARYC